MSLPNIQKDIKALKSSLSKLLKQKEPPKKTLLSIAKQIDNKNQQLRKLDMPKKTKTVKVTKSKVARPKRVKLKELVKDIKPSQSNKQIVKVIVNTFKKASKSKAYGPLNSTSLNRATNLAILNLVKSLGKKESDAKKIVDDVNRNMPNAPVNTQENFQRTAREETVNNVNLEPPEVPPKRTKEIDPNLELLEHNSKTIINLKEKNAGIEVKLKELSDKAKLLEKAVKHKNIKAYQELKKEIEREKNNLTENLQIIEAMTEQNESIQQGSGLVRLFNSRKGDDGLYDHEIDDIMQDDSDYVGTIACDEIKDLNVKKDMNFIVNLDKKSESGSHWVACRVDSKDKTVEYYDPLGNPPNKIIDNSLKNIIDKLEPEDEYKYKINKKKNQDSTTSTCGHFAALFLLSREDGMSFKEATDFNEDDVEKERQKGSLQGFGYI